MKPERLELYPADKDTKQGKSLIRLCREIFLYICDTWENGTAVEDLIDFCLLSNISHINQIYWNITKTEKPKKTQK